MTDAEILINRLKEKLEDAVEALRDSTAIANQLFHALEKINEIAIKWNEDEADADVAMATIEELIYPFFVEPNDE